jgi:hypothetical protein
MIDLPIEVLRAFRQKTFRTLPGLRIHTKEAAIEYVSERGFIFFWPIKGVNLPSLWTAAAGDRPVANKHDDPGHITWTWKDSLLGKENWFYGKILRKKATMIAMDIVPSFYALSENYGAPEEDYLTIYEQGRMTRETKQVYEVIIERGPIDTVALRKAAHLSGKAGDSSFNRALADLQADFKIVPVAVTQSGAWRYAFAYDLLPRQYPKIPERARTISEYKAREQIITTYFKSIGAAQFRDITKLFRWSQKNTLQTIQNLVASSELIANVQIIGFPGEWYATPGLFSRL